MVIWSLPARNDLRAIHDFIANDSPFYAKKVVTDILDKSEVLGDFPRIGRVIPEINDDKLREVPVHAYRLMYRISDEYVYILALIHKRKEFSGEDISSRL